MYVPLLEKQTETPKLLLPRPQQLERIEIANQREGTRARAAHVLSCNLDSHANNFKGGVVFGTVQNVQADLTSVQTSQI